MTNKKRESPSGSSSIERRHILVFGNVQGVGYRKFAVEHAVKLSLTGFCKNLPSGEVEVEVQGPPEKIQELIGHLHKGPPRGRVDKVIFSSTVPLNQDSAFIIQY